MPQKDRLLDRYFQFLEVERNVSPHTITAYRLALEKFKTFASDGVSWNTATATHFRSFLLDCMKSGLARSYVRLTFAALRSYYRFLVERAGFETNPLREVQLPKMEKRLPVVLSVGQVDELLATPKKAEIRCAQGADDLRPCGIQQAIPFECVCFPRRNQHLVRKSARTHRSR